MRRFKISPAMVCLTRTPRVCLLILSLAAVVGCSSPEQGQAQESDSPVLQVAQAEPAEHPIDPALRIARAALKQLDEIKDYTATITKRERIGGSLKDHEYMSIKVRHEPFSVYLHFLGPDSVKDREVIYIAGENNNNLVSHEAGLLRNLGTMHLKTDGILAMQGQRYPITDIGIRNLVVKLIERAEKEKLGGANCKVNFYKNGKIDGRTVTCIELLHPQQQPEHEFYRARVFVDNELKIPIRYEAHDFPSAAGEEPELLEEYTYTNIKLNPGLADIDFSPKNPAYNYP